MTGYVTNKSLQGLLLEFNTTRNEVTYESNSRPSNRNVYEVSEEEETIESEAKARVKGIKENMAKLEAWIKEKADADGVTSFEDQSWYSISDY